MSASCGYCCDDLKVNAPCGGIVFVESLGGRVLIVGGAKDSARTGEAVLVPQLAPTSDGAQNNVEFTGREIMNV